MNTLPEQKLPAWLSAESIAWTVLVWVLFAFVPWWHGGYGLSWDALNHHIYLGWTAESHRFDFDFLPAAYQTYQFPYLYWPVYKLAMLGWRGEYVGIVLGLLHASVVPALCRIAVVFMPGTSAFDTSMRGAAVLLALMSGLLLSFLDSSANDFMAAIPFVWALAVALNPMVKSERGFFPNRSAIASGILVGVSVAFKLSNGPLAIVFPLIWFGAATEKWQVRSVQAFLGCCAVVAGFFLVYGYWGWQLWLHFGNPIYPFYDGAFAPLRTLTGWKT